jgi:hypothetical protein
MDVYGVQPPPSAPHLRRGGILTQMTKGLGYPRELEGHRSVLLCGGSVLALLMFGDKFAT